MRLSSLRSTLPRHARILAITAIVLAPAISRGQPALTDDFESSETSWRVSQSDVRHRIEVHERTRQHPHSGQWCERVKLSGDNGSYVYMSLPVDESRIISELTARLWLRSDRSGLQFLARVVLPRTIDPNTDLPVTMLVAGDSYTKPGVWQQLSLRDFPLLVERQTRVLRATLGPKVDAHEAFVDQLVLNVYGGPGITNVWIDGLEVTGAVSRNAIASVDPRDHLNVASADNSEPQRLPATWQASDSAERNVSEVRLQGNVLLVGGKPFFPRMVHFRGEPLELLKRLGFNTVRVPSLPDIELLDEARRNGMWIVAKPPRAADLTTRNASGTLATIGRDFDRVLAWDLGGGLTSAELDVVRPWIKALRTADPRRRPILCQPESDLRAYSRNPDVVLMVERRPLGTSQELNEYGKWLRSRTQLARPGTPVWTTIQTQPTAQLIEQLALLSQGQPPNLHWQHEQLRLLVLTALAAGMRGICFESLTPLDEQDPATRARAAILEWLNLELDLISPWTAGGVYVTTAQCTDPQLVGVVMQSERAGLLLPLPIAPQNQFAIDHGATGAVSFTVPGGAESNDAFELSPAGLRPLARKRVTGGLRITLSDGDRSSPVVMTQDPLVMATLARRATQLGRRMSQLQRGLSTDNLALVADVDRRLAAVGHSQSQNAKLIETARERLNQSESIAATNDLPLAQERVRQALLALRQVERSQWTQAAARSSPLASPFAVSFQTLPEHWQFIRDVESSRRGPNRLRGGDCESLETMLSGGWKHMQHSQAGLATSVELTAEKPHSGQFAMRMRVTPADKLQKPDFVETPPMWITTAPVWVEPGELLQISGFARVPKPIEGSVDGLLILDSITGDALAERIRTTNDWKEFKLYRIAPQSGNLTITFALTGLGEAWIDDVSIQAVDRGVANPQATRLPFAGSVVPALNR